MTKPQVQNLEEIIAKEMTLNIHNDIEKLYKKFEILER
jgi:hypothetical protein